MLSRLSFRINLLSDCHLQVDNLIPKHYLPPIIRLCGKLEMLDRLLPKLKATDHRVWNAFYMFLASWFVCLYSAFYSFFDVRCK